MERFSGQRDDEDVLFVFRRHIIAMRRGFYGLLIPFTLGSIPSLVSPDTLWLLWLSAGGFAVGLLILFYHWVGWYYSVFIVTNQRVQQVSQNGLFGRSVIDLSLSKIQNLSYNIPGLSGEMFGFGTIVLQTYVGDMVIDKVHKPGDIYTKLQQAIYDNVGKLEMQNEEVSKT